MGTPSTKKFIRLNGGIQQEETALLTTAGAGDANRLPALNALGVLDQSILNAAIVSSGVSDSGKTVALGADGRISTTMMPTGIGADTSAILTSEALSAGDFINIHNVTGVANVRKADASSAGKYAHGFVLSSFGSGVMATVYFEGANTAVTGQTPGDVYLSATTPGLSTSIAPSAAGQVVQSIGIATSETSVNFEKGTPVILAG